MKTARMKTACPLLLTLLLCAPAARADEFDDKMAGLLMPVARVTVAGGGGSGTVVYSADRDDAGRFETFILTNHHVIAGAVHIVPRWNSLKGRYENMEQRDRVQVETFVYDKGKVVETRDFQADIVAHSETHDIAVLRLCYPRKAACIAPLLPAGFALRLFQPVYAVGCSLLHEPIATSGHVTDLEDLLDGSTYCMCTAPIIFGNSGGGVFVEIDGTWYLAGVPSRIAVSRGSPITHMAWFVPPDRIRQWVKEQMLDFLVDPERTPKQCFEDRAKLLSPSPPDQQQRPEPTPYNGPSSPPRKPSAMPETSPEIRPEPAVIP
jgi:S1-C subfamily serine protease